MTPNRAATLFRELLQTVDAELGQFARRAGLHGQPDAQDLLRAREILEAVAAAIESNRGPDWRRVQDAWKGMREKHAPASTSAAAEVAGGYVAEPSRPAWIRDEVIAKPSLGSPAPDSADAGQQRRGKFIPVARPRFVPNPGGGATPDEPAAAAPSPLQPGPEPAPAIPPSPQPQYPRPSAAVAPAPGAGGPSAPGTTDEWGRPILQAPAMLAPAGSGSAQPVVPQIPEGFTSAPQGSSGAVPGQPPSAAAPPDLVVPAAAAMAREPPPPPLHREVALPPEPTAAPAAAVDQADRGSIYQSVAKYAAFCAACAEAPDRLADTMAGYGVRDAGERAALDQLWQDRFDDEPDALDKWEELFAHFRGSLRQRG
jgi:hypothetical protein